jgi:ABC-2 type transport system permease protein
VITFRHIVLKELREIRRQPGGLALATGIVALLVVTVMSGVPRHRVVERWKADATRDVREQWISQGARHPHSAAHYGIIAFRPLEGTALIEPGVSAFVGQLLPLETHTRAFPRYAPSEDATSASRFGALSPALLSLTLVPLAIILIGYGAVTRERESGSLGMALASGVSPRALLGGKVAAVAIVAIGIVALKTSIDALGVSLAGATLPIGRLLGVELVHATYALVWVALTIGVSARTRSSQTALSILLTLWVANSFVLPRVAASVGRLVVQEPSTEAFRAAIQHDITYRPDGTPWVANWSQALISETLEKYGVQRIEDLPVGYAGIMLKGSDAHHEEVFEKHFTRLHDLHRRQEAWHHALSLAGPMIAARSLGQAFAGTDLTHVHHFSDAAERYRRLFVEATNDAIEKGTTGAGWALRMDRSYWESIPSFRYEAPTTMWALRQHWVSIAVLLLWMGTASVWCARGHHALRQV